MQFRVSLLAALALGGVSSGAEAAIKVNAVVNGATLQCADAVNVKFSPAATRTDMRFTYECVNEGIARTCTPAAYTPDAFGDPDLQAGDPAFKYRAFAAQGGPVVTVVCDSNAAVALKGTEFVGEIDGQPLADCHPAVPIAQQPATLWSIGTKPVAQCVPALNANAIGTATCIEFRCPSVTANRQCFPHMNTTYAGRLPDTDTALRRVSLSCETMAPMLSHGFDE